MAIICTVETNDIWSYILNALRSKGIEGTASSQGISNNLTLLTTPLRTSELLDLCSCGEEDEIYVFFSPPSLVFNADSDKSDIAKEIVERTKLSEELLDLYYKFKHRVKLINSISTVDSSKRELVINGISIDLGSVSCPLSYRDLTSYLAFNNQIEKAQKIEKLLNGVSYVEGTAIDSLVNLVCDGLDRETEDLKDELEKNKEETTKLVEELASKSNSFDKASEELLNIHRKYKVLEKESTLESERLEYTVYSLQTRLEESAKRHETEIQENIAENKKSLEEAALVYENKIDLLNEKVASLTGELSYSSDLCNAYKEENIELKAQNDRLEESLFIAQMTLENFVKNSDSEIRKVNDNIQSLTTKIEDETRKREQAEAQSTQIKQDYEARLKSLKEDKTAEVEKQRSELTRLKEDYEARLKSVKDDKTAKIEKLKSAWKSEKIEMEKNAGLQASAKNKELVTLKVTSERVIDKLERENKSLQKELKSYQALYYQVKNDLDAVKGSTTWKTLSPVLKVKDKVLGKSQKFDQEELISNIGLLYTSDLFDAEWYLATYKDVAEQDLDPARHYLLHGFKEGRRPSMHFDGNWYFNYYEDVKAAGFNPLVHFIKYGKAEGRKTSHNLLMNLSR